MDEDAFHVSTEDQGEHVSGSEPESDPQNSTVSTVVIDRGEEEENDTENLPISSVTATDESYDEQRVLENMAASDDESTGCHMVEGVVIVEEEDEESGVSGVDDMLSDDEI